MTCITKLLLIGALSIFALTTNAQLYVPPTCTDAAMMQPANGAVNVCTHGVNFSWEEYTPIIPPLLGNNISYRIVILKNDSVVLNVDSIIATNYLLPEGILAAATVYKWAIFTTNNGGESEDCDTITFTTAAELNPSIAVIPMGDTLRPCLSSNFPLDGNVSFGTLPITHRWSGIGNNQLSDTQIEQPIFNSPFQDSVFTLTYHVVDANNCSDSATIILKVEPLPITGSFTLSDSVFCAGNSLGITVVATNMNYQVQDSSASQSWQNSLLDTVGANQFQIAAVNEHTAYRLAFSNQFCTVFTPTKLLTVNQNLIKPLVDTIGSASFCQGSSVTFKVSNLTDGLVWSNGVIGDAVSINNAGTYAVAYTDSNACVNVSDSILVVVFALPAKPLVTAGSSLFCSGDTIILSASGSNISWNDALSTTGNSLNIHASGVYVATSTDSNACENKSDDFNVNFTPKPSAPTITLLGTSTSCQGDFPVLYSSYNSGNTWSDGSTADSLVVKISASYSVSYTDSLGCFSISAATAVVVIPSPPTPTVVRSGDTLFADVIGVYVYEWFHENGVKVKTSADPFFKPVAGGNYFVVLTNTDGCQSEPSETFRYVISDIAQFELEGISVYPNPAVDQLTFDLGDNEKATLSSTDAYGKIVGHQKIEHKQRIDISHWSRGVYLLKISNEQGNKIFRVVKL